MDETVTQYGPEDDGSRTQLRTVGRGMGKAPVPSARVRVLVHRDEQGQVHRHRFDERPLIVGRRPPAGLVLADPEVSGQHCRLEPTGEFLIVIDLASTNGCLVGGSRVDGPVRLAAGTLLQVGRQWLSFEWRDAADVEQSEALDRDLARARHYVQSLLPPPRDVGALAVAWHFQPSAALGGDGFGYFALDERRWAGFLIDVAGHGVGSAMHSVTVMNVLRQRALPGVDMAEPTQVLAALNAMFPMEAHDGLFFTIWYGVYDADARSLRYGCGGHHPAYLRRARGGALEPLFTRNLMIGAMPAVQYTGAECRVEPGDRLYLFSDGVFEAVDPAGRELGLADFVDLLQQAPPAAGPDEPALLHAAALARRRPGPLDDDFSLLIVTYA